MTRLGRVEGAGWRAGRAAWSVEVPPAMLAAGICLQGRYQVDSVLGRGGMGAVYLARQTLLGKQVAIKELSLDVTDPEVRHAALQQFQREAEILGQLCHPDLVRVIDFFGSATYFLVMD